LRSGLFRRALWGSPATGPGAGLNYFIDATVDLSFQGRPVEAELDSRHDDGMAGLAGKQPVRQRDGGRHRQM
jgi:hypothetical protein